MNNSSHIDPDAYHLAEELLGNKAETIIDAAWISKINTKQNADHRFIIFTESQILLYKKPVLSKVLKISRSYFWFDLIHVKLTSG